jgi:tungstate transport system substrate-binding protein
VNSLFKKQRFVGLLVLVLILGLIAGCSGSNPAPAPDNTPPPVSEKKDVILASTTSTLDTGLLDVLKPKFEEQTGYILKPIGVGSGAALKMGENGEADALLVHAPKDEEKLVEQGVVNNRQLVMHNDFIFVGPEKDPAGIKGNKSAVDALKKIAESKSLFVSRGDESGTHKMEKNLWTEAGIQPSGSWYQQAATGMAATLKIASEKQGYTLTDRGTYLAQKGNLSLVPMVEGDKVLLNIYHVMQVNPDKFSDEIKARMNPAGAKAFVEFMVSPDVQKIIETYGVDKYGEPLFFPDAGKNEADLGK